MDGNLPDNEAQMGFWARKGPWKISALMKKECSCDPQRGTWESVIKDRLGGLLHTQEGHSRELVTFFPELEGKAEAGWSFQTSLVCCGGCNGQREKTEAHLREEARKSTSWCFS